MTDVEWLGLFGVGRGGLRKERVFVSDSLVPGSSIPEERLKCDARKQSGCIENRDSQ